MILISPLVLTMRRQAPVLDNSAVVVRRGVIVAVGRTERILKKYPGHRVLRFTDAVLMPGLVNAHIHLELPPLLDVIRAETFPEWVLNLIRFKKSLGSNDYRSAARQNIETLIDTGTTTVGEICTHGVSPVFLKASGLRCLIYYEIIGMGSRVKGHGSWAISGPRAGRGLVQNGLSPHAPYTVSKELLLDIKRVSHENSLRLAMHVAESRDEIRLLQRKKSGLEELYHAVGWKTDWAPAAESPFEYLNGLGLLGRDFLSVHAVQTTDRDIAIMKKVRMPVAHCPRSNHETAVGRMPLKRFLDNGIHVGLGTDSLASSPSLSLWDEMRYARAAHRKDGITAQDIMLLATIEGAKALGLHKEIGTLEPGKKADIIAVPFPSRNTGDIYSDLLRETKSCIMSMVNGKIIYSPQRTQRSK
jgi:5-methylthioadenosine/S-adenosylhomocysteine deaminase